MKRLEMTVPLRLLEDLGIMSERFFRHNDRLEILQSFLVRPSVAAMFVRVQRRGPFKDLPAVAREALEIARRYRLKRFEVVSADPERGDYLAWIEWRVPPPLRERFESGLAGIVPLELARSGAQEVQVSLLASETALPGVRRLLADFRTPYRVRSVRSGPAGTFQPLSALTPRQRNLLGIAYRLGYYDSPSRVSLNRVAALVGISKAAVSKHLRAAERKILTAILGGTPEGLEYRTSGLPRIRRP
jgi:hypothetical protein